jgi:hypothetical protein
MILTSGDKTKYYPEVTATGDTLDGLIAIVQGIIEGDDGTNRPLEQIENVEIIKIHSRSRFVRLERLPIVTIASIEVRGAQNQWQLSSLDWQLVTSDQVVIDYETGQINFLGDSWGLISNYSEAKITYTAGYDFSSTTDPDVLKIKAIAGRALSYIFANGPQGISSLSTQTSATNSTATVYAGTSYLGLMLTPLGKYKPRPT